MQPKPKRKHYAVFFQSRNFDKGSHLSALVVQDESPGKARAAAAAYSGREVDAVSLLTPHTAKRLERLGTFVLRPLKGI